LATLQAACQPSKATAYFRKAQQAISTGDYAQARKNINKAVEADERQPDFWLFSADLARQSGDDSLALKHYRKVHDLGVRGGAHYRLSQGLFALADYRLAREHASAYLATPEAQDPYASQAGLMVRSCDFAIKALRNPKPFKPVNLGDGVNTRELEYQPSISVDGTRLIFTRRAETGPRTDEDFYETQRQDTLWSLAKPLEGLNTPLNEGAMCLSADGSTIIFTACQREDGLGSCDLYQTRYLGQGRWSPPQNLGNGVNTQHWESQPTLSADGRTLIFVRSVGRDENKADLMMARKLVNGSWGKAVPLMGDVNTPYKESSPFLHFDGKTLYFSSNGHPGFGREDFFVSRLNDKGHWGKPENLGYPINTHKDEVFLIVSGDGKTGYFASSGRPEGRGKLDLYHFQLPQEVQAEAVAHLEGRLLDARTGAPLSGVLRITALDSAQTVRHFEVDGQGRMFAVMPGNQSYAVEVERPGYLFYSAHFELGKEDAERAYQLEVRLQPLEVGATVVLRNVFFDTDKDVLKSASGAELDRLADFLVNNPAVRIEIGGHTDNQGSAAYNQGLSLRRAQAVQKYLAQKGISSNRMEVKGYGDTRPVASNEQEEGRALNRRTEVKIIQ
jgi:outer membrane protein OmpA-like peptidoglycan-associated protein